MAETTSVSNEDEFVQEIVADSDLDLTPGGAKELWSIWIHRYEQGATDDVLVALPGWFARDEFDKSWPYFFAQIEYDDPDSGAILFSESRLVDVNIIENEIWDHVALTKVLSVIDQTDNEHIEERGKIWIPRSLMHVFEIQTDESGNRNKTLQGIAKNMD